MIRNFLVYATVAVGTFLSACKNLDATDRQSLFKENKIMIPTKKFSAQVVGMVWLNPFHRKDYPTEWQVLWAMDLIKPNIDDDMLRKKPEVYSKVQYVSLIADGSNGKTSKINYHLGYQYELIGLLHDNYYADPNYFYNVHDVKRKKYWRELAGIRVEYALPNKDFDAEAAGKRRSRFFKIPSPWVTQVVQPYGLVQNLLT